MKIKLTFPGEPKAVQSVRFARCGNFMKKYQPKEQVEWKNYLRLQAQSQLAKIGGFQQFEGPIHVTVKFMFSPLLSWSKKKMEAMKAGEVIYKETRPDLGDNLCKGTFDAMTGIVWRDDSLICSLASMKMYAFDPCIILEVEELK